MRITIVTDNQSHAESIRKMLQADEGAHSLSLAGDGMAGLSAVLSRGQTDLIILDGICCAVADLDALGKLTQRYPQVAFIMLCPEVPPALLIQAMHIGVRDVLPGTVVAEELRAAVARQEQRLKNSSQRPAGKVLAFIACKGGSGATFLASNLGYVLAAEYGKRVALIDMDLHYGDAMLFVTDQVARTTLADVAKNIARLDATFLDASMLHILPNYNLLAAPDNPAQTADVQPQHIDAILKLAIAGYDYAILDVERNFDARSIKALDHADAVFLVLQETIPFIRDAKRIVSTLQSLGYGKNKIHLIVNRNVKESEISVSDVEQTLGMKVFLTIPNSYGSVSASVNQGVPMLKIARHDPVTKGLLKMGHDLEHGVDGHKKNGWLGRLFGSA